MSSRLRAVLRAKAGRRGWQMLAATLILAVVTALTGGALVARDLPFSPYDDPTHLDYAWELAHGRLIAPGSPLDAEVLNSWSCLGQARVSLPACDSGAPAAAYPNGGTNYNFGHPPVYYAITGVLARVGDHLTPGTADFVEWDRAVGLLWLLAGAVVLYAALRTLRAGWSVATAGAVLAVVWTPFSSAAVYGSNDGAALLGGALAAWLGARVLVEHRLGLVLPVLLTGFVAGTKVINALALLAVAAVLVLVALVPRWNPQRLSRRRLGLIAVEIVAVVGAVTIGWARLQAGRGDPHWVNPIAGQNTRPLPAGDPLSAWITAWARSLHAPLGGFSDGALPATGVHAVFAVVAVLALMAPAGVFLFGLTRGDAVAERRVASSALAAAASIGFLVMPLVVELQSSLTSAGRMYFPKVNDRYGLSVQVLLMVCLALLAARSGRAGRIALWGTTAVLGGALAASAL